MKVICPKCNKPAPWVENKEKYGRNFGKSFMCYFCKPCGTYVGCHNNTRTPLGTMADNSLMKIRRNAHAVFDKLWKGKEARMSRKEAYQLLKEKFGKEIHIASASIEECKRLTDTNFLTTNRHI